MKQLCAVGAVLAAALLSGCVVAPYPSADPYYGEPVMVAPPLGVAYPGPPPVAGQVWIGGYWNWYGSRRVWVPGRWDAPHRGPAWGGPRWDRDGPGWRPRGGGWGGGRPGGPRGPR